MKNIVLKLSFGILALTIAISASRLIGRLKSNNSAVVTQPTLIQVSENLHDFGKISINNGKVSYIFNIKNISAQPVTISKIYTSCMCTTAFLILNETEQRFGPFGMPGHGPLPTINRILGPTEEGKVEVFFDPAAHGPAGLGLITRTVYIESREGAPVEINIKAMVTP